MTSDCIDRQAVLKAINNMVKECDSVYVTSALRNLEVIVADLPSAQPVAKDTNVLNNDTISRQAAIDVLDKIFPADPMRNDYTQGITCGAALATEYIKQLPSAQPTLYGYNIEHLELIARVLQKEDLSPERVVEILTDIGRIVAIVRDEFEETLRKAVEQCMT